MRNLAMMVFLVMLVVGCDGVAVGKPAHWDAESPGLSATHEEREVWQGAQTDVYERGYRDGHDAGCDLLKDFLNGDVSAAGAERENERRARRGYEAYESVILQNKYREGFKDGQDTVAGLMLLGVPCS